MTAPTRRSILAGLAAVTMVPFSSCRARDLEAVGRMSSLSRDDPFGIDLDASAIHAIESSYSVATRDSVGEAVAAELFPSGVADVTAIRVAATRDFTKGRVFEHAGWRLSFTEGRLFTLLSRSLR